MRRAAHALFAATAGLLLVAGLSASSAEATARPTLVPSHVHSTETSMPGMDHVASPMPGMPGMDHGVETPMPGMDHEASPMPGMPGMGHNSGSESRPRALLLGGFGGLNGVVLITALVLRRRTKARHR